MATIKPAEVSAILKEQLTGFEGKASLTEIGTVLQIGDGIARIYGLSNVQYGELVVFEGGLEGIVLNLEEDNVGVVLLGLSSKIKEGDTVIIISAMKMESEYKAPKAGIVKKVNVKNEDTILGNQVLIELELIEE